MPTEKAPYRLVIKLDGARPDRLAEALSELREIAGEHDQTGDATATMTIECHQEAPLQAVMESFENWLFHHMQGLDCEMKLTRPGLRPETRDLLMRAKRETPMDKEGWSASPAERAMDWLVAREEAVSSDREPGR
jgi:hypothetical protein